jgi:hypothetical protein
LRPQRPQKREFSGSCAAHRGHGYVEAEPPGVIIVNDPLPHRPQNRTPSAKREPQFEHPTMPGITLDSGELLELLPCDDVGWLPGPCTVRN